MLAEALRTLYGYNIWATERLIAVAADLAPERLLAPGHAGHGSIRDTLVHLMATHRGWLSWWDGSLPPAEAYALQLDPATFPDAAALRVAWAAIAQQTRAFVAGLSDEEAGRALTHALPNGTIFSMALWQMMLHVANHGTQHRSEVAAMLTAAGHSPGNLDLLYYCMAHPASRPA
jgi:uncharacterized damage-inducible protein DinB